MTASQPRSAAAVRSESSDVTDARGRLHRRRFASAGVQAIGVRHEKLTWCPPSWTAFAVHAPDDPVPAVVRTFIRSSSTKIQCEDPPEDVLAAFPVRSPWVPIAEVCVRRPQPSSVCRPTRVGTGRATSPRVSTGAFSATSRPASSPRGVADDDRNRPVRPGLEPRRRVHLDQLRPVWARSSSVASLCGQVRAPLFDLDRNLRVGFEIEVPHRVFSARPSTRRRSPCRGRE